MRSAVPIAVLLLGGCCGCPPPCGPALAPAPTAAIAADRQESEESKESKESEAGVAGAPLALLQEADGVFRSRRYDAARPLYERALAAAERSADARVVVEALAQIARTHSLAKEGEEGRRALARAAALATPEEPYGWTRYLGVRGIFEREAGRREAAVATFEEMYAYAMARGLHRRALDAAHHVAIAADPQTQIAWGRKGIAAAEAMADDGWLAVLWNNLGATYEDLKRYDDALAAYEKARVYHHRGEAELPKMIADWAVGHAHRLAGHGERAAEWLERALAWARRIEDPRAREWEGYCLEDLGLLAVAGGERERGLEHLRAARARFVAAGMGSHWPEHLAALEARIEALEAE